MRSMGSRVRHAMAGAKEHPVIFTKVGLGAVFISAFSGYEPECRDLSSIQIMRQGPERQAKGLLGF